MLVSRVLPTLAIAGCGALSAVGVVALPAAAKIGVLIGGVLLGAAVFTLANEARQKRPRRWAPRTVAMATGGAVIGGGFTLAGLLTLLGLATVPVLMLVVLAAWLWHKPPRSWWPQSRTIDNERSQNSGAAADSSLSEPEPPVLEGLSTPELCHEWRRSYLMLLDAHDQQAWQRVIVARRAYLDELERRDPEGFSQWLSTGARAGSNPNRFLTGDSH